MIELVADAGRMRRADFDAIFDVRSPGEFEEDHIPGAENHPALTNEERARVGFLYTQSSKFEARKVGAALIARNVAALLEGRLADLPGGFHVLIYCWRGGQRSRSVAHILSEVGWRVGLLEGGYRTYRRAVSERLYTQGPKLRLIVLSGGTGVGKTEILRRLKARGAQVLDLEAAAGHRGSLFGGLHADQPPQKLFESRLCAALDEIDPAHTIFVEDEASRIGDCFVPPAIYNALSAAPRIRLSAPADSRAAYIAQAYAPSHDDRDLLRSAIAALPRHHAARQKEQWMAHVEAGAYEALALELIQAHYDPAYSRAEASREAPRIEIRLEDLTAQSLEAAAADVLSAASQLRLTCPSLDRQSD